MNAKASKVLASKGSEDLSQTAHDAMRRLPRLGDQADWDVALDALPDAFWALVPSAPCAL